MPKICADIYLVSVSTNCQNYWKSIIMAIVSDDNINTLELRLMEALLVEYLYSCVYKVSDRF